MQSERFASRRVAFARIADEALGRADSVLMAFLPSGRREGQEWVSPNPTRSDHSRGSFKVNVTTGKWSDFATGDRGGDLISLVAYVCGLPQREAAIRLAEAMGVTPMINEYSSAPTTGQLRKARQLLGWPITIAAERASLPRLDVLRLETDVCHTQGHRQLEKTYVAAGIEFHRPATRNGIFAVRRVGGEWIRTPFSATPKDGSAEQ